MGEGDQGFRRKGRLIDSLRRTSARDLLKITEVGESLQPPTSVVPRKRGPGRVRQKTLDSRSVTKMSGNDDP